ncbi:MAG: peptidoglycan editing factor PgeF [Cyanobacteria bacterium REEB459]|nr:peptidoglycan editing factor PgeF [Cyanobacteria bacterium REEB459]
MSLWQWSDWNSQAYLTCSLLQPWAHGFFTRASWPQLPDRLTAALDPSASVQRVQQVHGNRVMTPTDVALASATDQETPVQADALVSDGLTQALWVCSADCNPVLIGDRRSGRVAAIHAGWRGTALKIVPQTVARMAAAGSQIEDLVVAIGPAIAGEVYQVSQAVAEEVGRTLVEGTDLETGDFITHLQNLGPQPILPDQEPGKARLDVRLINFWQLTHLGLGQQQIAIAPHCTFQEPDRFFSYRRSGEKQVQWSGIVSRHAGRVDSPGMAWLD